MIGGNLNVKGLKIYRLISKNFLLILIAIWGMQTFAQNNNIEEWRKKGYEAKLEGEYNSAVIYYHRVLELQADDYDAHLAIARLHYLSENYKTSMFYFNKMLANDATDVEALKGLGDNYLNMDELYKAIEYYERAISYLPDYVPLYLQLAKAYSWQGSLNKAIETYQAVLKIDDTYSEVWQGIGKMYYWKEKPKTAISFYERAIELDPLNKNIKKEYEELRQALQYKLSGSIKILNETEESYKIDAFVQKYGLQKRWNDQFSLSLYFLLDHSHRNFTNTDIGDTVRWYDNTWLKAGWISEHHKLFLYGGYSNSDNKFSTYGINWKWNFSVKSVNFKNSVTAGYDYFYYWNRIGQNMISDNLTVMYKKLGLNLGYGYGIIDNAPVIDVRNDKYFESTNTRNGYNISFLYKIAANPKITLAANYSYLNYKYKSAFYYSPYGRNLFGPSANLYFPFSNFYVYGDFSYNFGSEYYYDVAGQSQGNSNNRFKKVYLNANNWSANAEFGYEYKSFVASINASRFYNNYYSHYFISLNLKFSF